MGRAASLFASFWSDRDNRRMSPSEKLLFLFLISHQAQSGGSVSGIYQIEIEDMALWTGLPADEVKAILTAGKDGKLLTGLRNIVYDTENGIVMVLNKLRYTLGGRPDLNAKSIVADYRLTLHAKDLWKIWKEHHKAYIETEETGLVKEVLSRDKNLAFKPGKQKGKPVPVKTEDDLDKLMERYTELLDDDLAMVQRVFKHLTTNMKNGGPISLEQRLRIAEDMSKEPVLKVARAAFEFINGGYIDTGKRAKYFFGIMRGSANSWYIEYRNAKDKEEFNLEEPKDGKPSG